MMQDSIVIQYVSAIYLYKSSTTINISEEYYVIQYCEWRVSTKLVKYVIQELI
jgi:hypothetical protein